VLSAVVAFMSAQPHPSAFDSIKPRPVVPHCNTNSSLQCGIRLCIAASLIRFESA